MTQRTKKVQLAKMPLIIICPFKKNTEKISQKKNSMGKKSTERKHLGMTSQCCSLRHNSKLCVNSANRINRAQISRDL